MILIIFLRPSWKFPISLYLSSRLSAAILPALLEPCVPVTPDDAVIESGTIHIPHGVLRILPNIVSVLELKELEHRKLGWKVLILKYDLGKSLSKEMWCKMADTKTFLDNIFNKRAQRALDRSPETKDFKFPFFIALSTTGNTWQSKS